jgi:DNA-binding CsgD family transcriptional regulator
METTLVDRIYESAFVPELWPKVLGDLAEIAGARTGFLYVSRDDIHAWTYSNPLGLNASAAIESGAVARSDRFRRIVSHRHSGFVVEDDIYTREELAADPFYRDMLYPRGLGWAAATTVHLPTGDNFVIGLERELARGPVEAERVERLDRIRPHLGRAALMSSRMRLEQAKTISDTLGAVGLAAAVLDSDGNALAVNTLIDAMPDVVQARAFGRLGFGDRAAHRLLTDAITRAEAGAEGGVRSFPVRGADGEPALIAHVIPVRLSARDIFSRSAAVLVLTPVALPTAAPVELVQSLFDLTPAEARVARNLAAGKTADDIAGDGGVSINTVRAQVRAVLEKTGCGRQADVVALLTAISSTTPRGVGARP